MTEKADQGKSSLNSGSNGVHAPFNFVPLSKRILNPDWSALVSQDKPLSDGICGILNIEITAKTPLLVGDEKIKESGKEGKVHFNRLPNGRYAIPGTSLRGMLRSVLEIATFSGMKIVENQRFSVRDLQNPDLYGNKMSEKVGDAWKSKSLSGWLCFKDGKWNLYRCNHSRIDFSEIKISGNSPLLDKSNRCISKEKYNLLRKKFQDMKFPFRKEEEKSHNHSKGRKLYYSKAFFGGQNNGYLVVTGQPGPQKHMEFIFEPPMELLDLPEQVLQDFLFIHKDTNEWKYLSKESPFPKEVGIPVFYLSDGGKIAAMGLAQMFKLAYTYSTHDMIKHTYKDLGESLDFVETLFGRVSNTLEETIKGRVSFGDAESCSSMDPLRQNPTILSSPKPSYYPIYLKQVEKEKTGGCETYKTYMDPDAEISGWKRYPVRKSPFGLAPEGKAAKNGNDAKVILNPLPSGTIFNGKIRFHNLKPEELGAIIWGLEWGGDPTKCHSLGMGKPFGFGSISVKIKDSHLIPNCIDAKTQDVYGYRKVFVDYMEQEYSKWLGASNNTDPDVSRDWLNTPQMKQLLAMADPENSKSKNLTYMKLKDNNEFIKCKGKKEILKLYI
jgi:CRISPR-associated protein (TIGR03986 family)